MSNDAPAYKRARTDSNAAEPADPIRSHIWKPFGDIILQAESTQFRVNRDVLAEHSSVFRDMFSVPQPANEPTIEGCAVVQVSDPAKAWELLLGALYDPFQFGEEVPFELLAAMLRLGKKYEMTKIKSNAVARLHHDFPTTLEAWDANRRIFGKVTRRAGILADLLCLAHEYGVKSSIPVLALTTIGHRTLEDLLNDTVVRPDGSVVIIPIQIKLMLAVAAERIYNHNMNTFKWLEDDSVLPSKGCMSNDYCVAERQQLHRTFTRGNGQRRYLSLETWTTTSPWVKLCQRCSKAGKSAFASNRSDTWEVLPAFFGLPEWKDLQDDD